MFGIHSNWIVVINKIALQNGVGRGDFVLLDNSATLCQGSVPTGKAKSTTFEAADIILSEYRYNVREGMAAIFILPSFSKTEGVYS